MIMHISPHISYIFDDDPFHPRIGVSFFSVFLRSYSSLKINLRCVCAYVCRELVSALPIPSLSTHTLTHYAHSLYSVSGHRSSQKERAEQKKISHWTEKEKKNSKTWTTSERKTKKRTWYWRFLEYKKEIDREITNEEEDDRIHVPVLRFECIEH